VVSAIGGPYDHSYITYGGSSSVIREEDCVESYTTRSAEMDRPVHATVNRVVNGPRPRRATLTTVADTPPLVRAHERDSIQDIAEMGLKAEADE
jgi:hypothetical protein